MMNLYLWVACFTCVKILLKTLKRASLHENSKMDLTFMNISDYQKSTLGGPMAKQFVLQSCFINVLPRHTNLFDECTARCVHPSPQEEECTPFFWRDSKINTSGSIAYSQRMVTEINESSRYSQNKYLSGKWYCQT